MGGASRLHNDSSTHQTAVMSLSLFEEFETGRMPARCTVRFEPSGASVVVEPGTLLIDAARAAGMPVAQSCGGWAICSWCKMQVLAGGGNLSPIEGNEARLAARQSFAPNERASCQAEVFGDVTVTTTYW